MDKEFTKGDMVIDNQGRVGRVMFNNEYGLCVAFARVKPEIPGEYVSPDNVQPWYGLRDGIHKDCTHG